MGAGAAVGVAFGQTSATAGRTDGSCGGLATPLAQQRRPGNAAVWAELR